MRRRLCAVPMMLFCLLLTSCGGREEPLQDALTFRSVLLEAGGCQFTAEIVTEVEMRGYAFTLDATYETGGRAELTVTAPDSIRGIRAEMTAADAVLDFENAALDFGKLDDAMTSPLYLPYVLGACWESAYIDCTGRDGDLERVTYRLGYEEAELIAEVWFRDTIPVRTEIYQNETLLLSAKLENFTFLP